MFASLSETDLQLLGYTDVTRDTSFDATETIGVVSQATTPAGIRKITETFVYLKSKTTRKQAEDMLSNVKKKQKGSIFVIIPQSIVSRFEISTLCNSLNLQYFVYEDMIWDRVYSLFEEYVNSLSENIIAEETDLGCQ